MNMLRLAFLLFVAVFLTQGTVTASSDLPSNVWTSLTQLRNFVQNTISHTRLPSTLRADFPVGCDAESGVNSTDCDTAKKDFQDAVSTCRVAYLANGFLDPLSVNTSDINTFCFEGCNNRVYAQVAQVARSCFSNTTGFDASSVENFEAALAVITATCLFVGDNEVCFNQLQNITRVADSIKNGSLTEDQLEELCFYPCVDGQYRALKSVSQGRYLGVVGFYKQFCSNIDDEWCAVEYQDAVAQEQKAPTKTKTTKAVCSPCNRRFVQSASKNLKLAGGSVGSFSSADFDAKVNALTYRCDADRHGKFCTEIVDKKAKKPVDISACQGLFDATLPSSCSSECATQLRAQIEATECCTLTDYKRRLNASLANGSNPQVGAVYDYIRNQCNVSLANTCSKQVITFSLGLSNVNDDWINNADNKAAFSQALRQDLSAQFGVPLDNVVVSSVEFVPAANGSLEVACVDGVRVVRSGIRVTGYIVPPSGQGASILYTEFSNAAQDDLLELGQTATVLPLNYDGRTDVLSPFERNFRIGSEVGLASNPNGPQ